jgi:hypothetical protein
MAIIDQGKNMGHIDQAKIKKISVKGALKNKYSWWLKLNQIKPSHNCGTANKKGMLANTF